MAFIPSKKCSVGEDKYQCFIFAKPKDSNPTCILQQVNEYAPNSTCNICKSWDECHWSNWVNDIRTKLLIDIVVFSVVES